MSYVAGLADMLGEEFGPYLERIAKAQEKQTEYLRIIANLQYMAVTGTTPIGVLTSTIDKMIMEADKK